MKKIIVIGCPGSGKSTFSRALQEITGIPLIHLDMLYWNSDRTTVEKTVFLERLTNVLNDPAWILDGNYASTMELRLQFCDTVVFLDYPTELCLNGIRERRGKPRADLPWVEPVTEEDAGFVAFIKEYQTRNRPLVMELLNKHSCKNIFILKDRNEADAFLSELKRKHRQ